MSEIVQKSFLAATGELRTAPDDSVEAVRSLIKDPPAAGPIVIEQGDPFPHAGEGIVELESGDEAPPDGRLPLGYHRLRRRDGSSQRLIVCPARCYLPEGLHAWAWALQLYSLRSRRSWGMGDLADLGSFGAWARTGGASAVMLNPLHAPIPVVPRTPSPYYPSTRCAYDPIYIAAAGAARAAGVAVDPDAAARGAALNRRERIDRDEVYRTKREELWRIFEATSPTMVTSRPEVLDVALFDALAEHHGGGPSGWPSALRDRSSPAVARWRDEHESAVAFHRWLQDVFVGQLTEATRSLPVIADVAVGVDPEGADVWMWPDVFVTSASAGAPPDVFNPDGQDWGLPPMDPHALAAAEYEPFIAVLRSAMQHAGGIRLDHVMGLFRMYWILRGAAPGEGVYVRYPWHDLLLITALESVRNQAVVIGEDLGTVEPQVRREMQARGMLGFRLLWFEQDDPAEFVPMSVAAPGSHDLPTIAGLWTGADAAEREALGLPVDREADAAMRAGLASRAGLAPDAPVAEAVVATYRSLARAGSMLVLANVEDAAAAEARPNHPGTIDERPNWAIPLPATMEELTASPLAARVAVELGRARKPGLGEPVYPAT